MPENNNIVNHLRLVIRISHNSLSFASVNSESEGQISFEPYLLNSGISMAANLREAFRSKETLQRKYGRVLVMIDSPVLMVPIEMYHEEEQRTLYLHTHQGHEQDEITHTVLPDLNCVAVFSVNKDLKLVLDDHFEKPTFIAAIAPVWRYLHQRSYMGVRNKLFAYFHDRRMEVFCYAQNRFKFCNSFAVNNANDALYYLLYVWKQLSLDARHDELYLAGDTPDEEALMEEAQKFVKRVFHIYPSGEFNRSPVTQIDGMPYDLMALYMHKV